MLSLQILLTFWLSLTSAYPHTYDHVTNMNPIATNVYWKLAHTQRGNFIFSPCSLGYALSLIESGARGPTAEEIRRGLFMFIKHEEIEDGFEYLKESFKRAQSVVIRLVNKLYLNKLFVVNDIFKITAADLFGASMETIDFEEPLAATNSINRWVENQTEHKIRNLVETGFVNFNTVAILVNALYFRGNWSRSFQYTDKRNFFVFGTNPIEVDTMHLTTWARYYTFENEKVTTLELPLEGDDVIFTIVLPHERTGLRQLEQHHTLLEPVMENRRYFSGDVQISLPKFRMETKVDFRNVLPEMGIGSIFDERSDLSGIAGEKGQLVIERLLQKSFISVNERGVEVASGTTDVALEGAGVRSAGAVKTFQVDRPFMFHVRFKEMMILAGRVVDPEY